MRLAMGLSLLQHLHAESALCLLKGNEKLAFLSFEV